MLTNVPIIIYVINSVGEKLLNFALSASIDVSINIYLISFI